MAMKKGSTVALDKVKSRNSPPGSGGHWSEVSVHDEACVTASAVERRSKKPKPQKFDMDLLRSWGFTDANDHSMCGF